jgi:hypothetical protein
MWFIVSPTLIYFFNKLSDHINKTNASVPVAVATQLAPLLPKLTETTLAQLSLQVAEISKERETCKVSSSFRPPLQRRLTLSGIQTLHSMLNHVVTLLTPLTAVSSAAASLEMKLKESLASIQTDLESRDQHKESLDTAMKSFCVNLLRRDEGLARSAREGHERTKSELELLTTRMQKHEEKMDGLMTVMLGVQASLTMIADRQSEEQRRKPDYDAMYLAFQQAAAHRDHSRDRIGEDGKGTDDIDALNLHSGHCRDGNNSSGHDAATTSQDGNFVSRPATSPDRPRSFLSPVNDHARKETQGPRSLPDKDSARVIPGEAGVQRARSDTDVGKCVRVVDASDHVEVPVPPPIRKRKETEDGLPKVSACGCWPTKIGHLKKAGFRSLRLDPVAGSPWTRKVTLQASDCARGPPAVM